MAPFPTNMRPGPGASSVSLRLATDHRSCPVLLQDEIGRFLAAGLPPRLTPWM